MTAKKDSFRERGPSFSDVQAKITAASDGDTVNIPANKPNEVCTWSTSDPLTITNKNVPIIGAGKFKSKTMMILKAILMVGWCDAKSN